MIHEIEQKTLELITAKLTEVREIKIQKGGVKLTNPAVFVACERGSFSRIAQQYKQEVDIYIEIEFKNLANEEERRKGAEVIIEAILQYMIFQTLGLAITPLEPASWEHITDEADFKAGLIRYQMVFKTTYNLAKLDEEEVTDLLSIGLNYFLKPGDEKVDAQDVMTLET